METKIQIGKPLKKSFEENVHEEMAGVVGDKLEKSLSYQLICDLVEATDMPSYNDFMSLYIKIKHVDKNGNIGWSAGRGVDVGHVFDE